MPHHLQTAAAPVANTATTTAVTEHVAGGQQLALGEKQAKSTDTSAFLADPVVRKDHTAEVRLAHQAPVRNERDFMPAGSPAKFQGNAHINVMQGPHSKGANMQHRQTGKPGQM